MYTIVVDITFFFHIGTLYKFTTEGVLLFLLLLIYTTIVFFFFCNRFKFTDRKKNISLSMLHSNKSYASYFILIYIGTYIIY